MAASRGATRTTPLQWLLDQRLARAQTLLESTGLSMEKVAALSGLGTANNLRHHFLEQVGVTPGDYRRAFPRPSVDARGEPLCFRSETVSRST
ncbi:helix-turn-helix domain-containing protein [Amycolatopsis sp. NPDC004772]